MEKIVWMALSVLSFNVLAQSQHTGRVIDAETNQPLVGATIQLTSGRIAISDSSGYFDLKLPEQVNYEVSVSFVGYSTYTGVLMKQNKPWNIKLIPNLILTDEVLVTATRAQENAPVTYKTLKKKDIEAQNFGKDFPYMLEQTASIVTTSDAGAGVGYTGIRIRGSDATRVNVTLNGIPYNDSESSGVFWVDLPDMASSVNSVQVQRGVGTSTNGAGAFGASINIKTTNLTTKPYAQIDNSFGSFNTRKHNLQAGTGLLYGKFSFDGRISKIYSNGYIDRASSDLSSYFVSGGYYGKKSMLKLNIFSGHEITYQSWYGTPEARINNDQQGMMDYIARNGLDAEEADNLLNAGRTYNFYTYANQVDDYTQTHYQLLYAWDVMPDITLNAALHYTKGSGYYEQYKKDQDLIDYGFDRPVIGTDTIFSTNLIRRRWLDNDFYGTTFSVNYTPSNRLTLLVGGAWNQYDGDHFGKIIWSEFTGNSTNIKHYYDNNGLKTDFTLYTKISWQPQAKFLWFADIQYRQVGYLLQGVDNDQRSISQNNTYKFVNPKIGVTYRFSSHEQLYASYAIGQKEPNRSDFTDWPTNQTPNSEFLQNIEAGYKLKTSKVNLQANSYLMDYRNQLVVTGQLNDVGAPLRTNVPKSYRVGLELEGAVNLSTNFVVQTNAAFSKNALVEYNEILYDYGPNWDEYNELITTHKNTQIAFSPNVIAGVTLSYIPFTGATISWINRYVGKQYLDNTQNENRTLSAYYISDVMAGYKFSALGIKKIEFKIAGYNIFNTLYESNGYTWGYKGGGTEVRENFYYPQAGTHIMVGLTLLF